MTVENQRIREFHDHVRELNGGTWLDCEPHLSALYRAILRPGAVAMDGGANIGKHTFQMAHAVLPNGLVLAIEPVPEMLCRLETSLRQYGLPEKLVRLLPYCLYSSHGEADFYHVLDPCQHELSGLRRRSVLEELPVKQIRVELTMLDTLCQDLDRLDFLKLDLEGAEMEALRGGRLTLERFRPVVAFEQEQNSPQYFNYTWDDLLEHFVSMNYELYDLFGFRYTEPAMLDACAMWDFIAFPAEYPDKQHLFGEVRQSMEAAGLKLSVADSDRLPARKISRKLKRNRLSTACVLDSVRVSRDAPIELYGWAVDEPNGSAAGGVYVVIDDVAYRAMYLRDRPDVAFHFKNIAYQNSGFSLTLEPGALPKGGHTVSLLVISHDGKSYYESRPGGVRILVD